ncbi:MAG: hypothetical protein PVH19_10555, partial [Planctomycetia bacterium]
MPLPGHAWWHLILSGHCSWLPGDPRGFRSRAHRVHSSGDYKNLPPEEEHKGLRCYNEDHAASPRVFLPEHRKLLGEAMVDVMNRAKLRFLAVAVGVSHAHVLVECKDDYMTARRLASSLKQVSSFAVRDSLPGKVWAKGGKPIRIKDQKHQQQVFYYILEHAQKEGAWVWRF